MQYDRLPACLMHILISECDMLCHVHSTVFPLHVACVKMKSVIDKLLMQLRKANCASHLQAEDIYRRVYHESTCTAVWRK